LKNAIYDVLSTVAGGKRTCALRAPTRFSVRIENIRSENPVMKLLRNNCLYRANVFVILIAADGRAKDKSMDDTGLVLSNIATLQQKTARPKSPRIIIRCSLKAGPG
jgi:hypothetical protein